MVLRQEVMKHVDGAVQAKSVDDTRGGMDGGLNCPNRCAHTKSMHRLYHSRLDQSAGIFKAS